jgi:hypothetical protein
MGATRIYREQGSIRAARLTAAHTLAFLALLLHIALPPLLQIAGPATQGLFETVICAGGENKTIYLDAEGNPVEPASSGRSHDCNSCLHHCGAALVSSFAFAVSGWTLPALAAPAARVAAAILTTKVQPRAPPAT